MYILDKNNDFYDFYSNVYGIDKSIVFDRRGSIIFTDEDLVKTVLKIVRYRDFAKHSFVLLIEIGYKQFLIKVKDIKISYQKHSCVDKFEGCSFELMRTFDEQVHLFDKEFSVASLGMFYNYGYLRWDKKENHKFYNDPLSSFKIDEGTIVSLPILKETSLTSILDPFEIWKELSTFISSQKNDKNVDIVNTDRDKIINHGLDVKTSFRHPIK